MKLDETVKLACNGGVGYNVLGEIPGAVKDGTFVLFAAHHDAHFRNGIDDTGAVASELTTAKAMMMSGYRPQHTVVFMSTTAEEYGYTNAWYDWSSGAWWTITRAHPDWAGRIRAFLNLETQVTSGRLSMGTSPDLVPWLKGQATAASSLVPSLLPFGSRVNVPASTWQDGWTFTAAGVPSVVFSTGSTPPGSYHTQYVDFSRGLVNLAYTGDLAKFYNRLAVSIDGGLLPYGLQSRADEVAAKVDATELTSAGADPAAVARLQRDVDGFSGAAATYEAGKGSIPACANPLANAQLLKIQKLVNGNLTALDAWDYTCYPHEQVMWDVEYLNEAIACLEQATPDTQGAMDALSNVALTGYGLTFSHHVYLYDLSRRDPDYYRVTWGAQGHLIHYLDVVPQYRAIEAGTWSKQTVKQLKAMRALDICDLNARLGAMSCTLEKATSLLGQVNSMH